MPFETQLPAPAIEWEMECVFPFINRGGIVTQSNDFVAADIGLKSVWSQDGSNPPNVAGVATSGGGATRQYTVRNGMLCAFLNTTGVICGQVWHFPWWRTAWEGGPAANINPGTILDPIGQLVCIWDLFLCFPLGLPGTGDGIIFVPYNGNNNNMTREPAGGATSFGGFGVVGNGLGSVNFETFEDGTGATLAGADLGSFVADISDWFNVRIIISPANSVRNATLECLVNGTSRYTDTFGSATLETPNSAGVPFGGPNYSYELHAAHRTVAAGQLTCFAFRGRWGRFLPDGTEVQGQ